jgi:hypothetical protein
MIYNEANQYETVTVLIFLTIINVEKIGVPETINL